MTGGDPHVTHLLLRALHDANGVDLQRLEELFARQRWRDLGPIVHRLKGAARMVGAHPLIEATLAYEKALAEEWGNEDVRLQAIAVRDAVIRLQAFVIR